MHCQCRFGKVKSRLSQVFKCRHRNCGYVTWRYIGLPDRKWWLSQTWYRHVSTTILSVEIGDLRMHTNTSVGL